MATRPLDAVDVLTRLIGKEIETVTGRPNRVLRIEGKNVIVATGQSPKGQPVPIDWVQHGLDLLAREGEVAIDVPTLRHRSAFVGAVLASLPGAIVTLNPATVRTKR